MVNLLIVEDDEDISRLIRTTLTQEGYQCTCALTGTAGAELLERNRYDLILLDLMLPGIGGLELLEYIRPAGTPVIIISAMGRVQDRIMGLRRGADDYLVKPFQIGELVARVESVLRRANLVNTIQTLGDVTVNPDARMVWKCGEPVELTMKEFDLLCVLLRNRNVALTRAFLYENVWEEEYTGETRTLDNHIQRLRKKLDWGERIETVFRIGYRLKSGSEERR